MLPSFSQSALHALTSASSPAGTPGGAGSTQGAPNAFGGTDPSSFPPGSQPPLNGQNGALGPHTGALPFAPSSVLPARPNLPDDPVIPHNGFATVEEGEKAFVHLLRKAGVDANWTWDQTMHAITTDPLSKALNSLAEIKAALQKVRRAALCYAVVFARADAAQCRCSRWCSSGRTRRRARSSRRRSSSLVRPAGARVTRLDSTDRRAAQRSCRSGSRTA